MHGGIDSLHGGIDSLNGGIDWVLGWREAWMDLAAEQSDLLAAWMGMHGARIARDG